MQWNAHTDAIWDLQHHLTKDLLVSCSADGTCKLWQTFSDRYEIKGKMLNVFSSKVENQFFYDTPTCVTWSGD